MKKLLTVTCLAGLLSIPSVVFADEAEMPAEPELSPEMQGHLGDSHSGPVWYGVIRVGISSKSGGDTNVASFGSRFGVRGTSEISEGLTAVYNYQQGINAANTAVVDESRLSYVGLTGGFGSLTLGRVVSASHGTVGVITNKTYTRSGAGAGASFQIGNAVSYALDVSGVKLQADVIMDGSSALPNDIDQIEFGISVPVGDIGKIAFAHVRKPGYTKTVPNAYLDVEVKGMIGKLALEFTEKVTTVAVPGVSSSGESTATIPKITLKPTTAKEVDDGKVVISLPSDSTLLSFVYTYEDTEKDVDGEILKGADGKPIMVDTPVSFREVWIAPPKVPKAGDDVVKVYGHTDIKLDNYTEHTDTTDATKSGFYHTFCYDETKKAPIAESKCVQRTQYIYDKNVNDASEPSVSKMVLDNAEVDVASTVTLATGTASVKTDIPALDVTINGNTVDKELKLTGQTVENSKTVEVKDYRSNNIAAEATFGAVKGYIGWSGEDTGGVKNDTTQFGISGPLGESGLSYLVEVSKEEVNTPFGIGIYKMLGGGAYAAFEHANDGDKGTSTAFIAIDF